MRIDEVIKRYEELDESNIPSNFEVRRALLKKGYVQREGGNHTKFFAPDGSHIPVPRHGKQIAIGTLRNIMKQAGLKDSDF